MGPLVKNTYVYFLRVWMGHSFARQVIRHIIRNLKLISQRPETRWLIG